MKVEMLQMLFFFFLHSYNVDSEEETWDYAIAVNYYFAINCLTRLYQVYQ